MKLKEQAIYQIRLNKEIERQENLERLNFNKCYEEEFKKLKKDLGWKFWITFNIWDKVSKKALVLYKNKYGELKDYGDLHDSNSEENEVKNET